MADENYRKVPPEGQFDKTSCWAASLAWWLRAVKEGRPQLSQSKLIADFDRYCDPDTGTFKVKDMIEVFGKDPRLKMSLGVFEARKYRFRSLPIGDKPAIVIFRHPDDYTHVNGVFEPNDTTRSVACMEPDFPETARDGRRTGRYQDRKAAWFFEKNTHFVLGWPTVVFKE